MTKAEERLRKYINTDKECVFDGKWYLEPDFYKDIETVLNMIEEARKYLTSYEAIHTIQFGNETDCEKDKSSNIGLDLITIECMTSRYLKVHNKLLKILGE